LKCDNKAKVQKISKIKGEAICSEWEILKV
jgi:hypothetical protein